MGSYSYVENQLRLMESFSYVENPFQMATLLIRPDFPGSLVAGLAGFHCIREMADTVEIYGRNILVSLQPLGTRQR